MATSRMSSFAAVIVVCVLTAEFGFAARVVVDSREADAEAKAEAGDDITVQALGLAEICGPMVEQSLAFCKKSLYEMEALTRRTRLDTGKARATARMEESDESLAGRNGTYKRCYIHYQEGSTLAEAERLAMKCCEQGSLNMSFGAKACALIGPTTNDYVSEKCNFRFAEKPWFSDICTCPEDRPHMLVNGHRVVRHTPGAVKLSFEPDDVKVCIDECYARSVESYQLYRSNSYSEWPVVFLVVYKLGGPVVHSNLAFCPNMSIVEGAHKCLQPGADPSQCSSSRHTRSFKQGPEVPELLMQHGCRELIYDGNRGGGIWSPSPWETGCWAQGADSQRFWWSNGNRKSLGYPWMYWLTSSNTVTPFAPPSDLGRHVGGGISSVEEELTQCFSSTLQHRLDFNPGSYSLLHHNCNKFSSEAMRYLGLPLFSGAPDKGKHPSIAFSATAEESWWRRNLYTVTGALFGRSRPKLSEKCYFEFFKRENNCRRVSGGSRYGDCPEDGFGSPMQCYDPSKIAIATSVGYQGSVNGVCGIPNGDKCALSLIPCQPGAKCLTTRRGNNTVYVCQWMDG